MPLPRLSALLAFLSLAASSPARDYKFFAGGLNLSTFDSDSEDAEFHEGFHLAFGYEIELESLEDLLPVALHTALSVETRGEEFSEGKAVYSMKYLQLPLLAKFSYEKGDAALNLLAGPEFGYFLWRTASLGEDELDNENLPDVRRFDAGLSVGAGWELSGSSAGMFMRGMYYHGLLDALEDDSATPEDESIHSMHRNLKLAVGLKLKTRW